MSGLQSAVNWARENVRLFKEATDDRDRMQRAHDYIVALELGKYYLGQSFAATPMPELMKDYTIESVIENLQLQKEIQVQDMELKLAWAAQVQGAKSKDPNLQLTSDKLTELQHLAAWKLLSEKNK